MRLCKPNPVAQSTAARVAAAALTLIAAATLGCSASADPSSNPDLRSDLAAIRAVHGDSEAIGSLDASAQPLDLNRYHRTAPRPTYRTVSTTR
jgi:hypothetical protein